MRKRIFEIVDASNDNSLPSKAYDITMMIVIIISIVPLAFKTQNQLFVWIDKFTCIVFIVDYVLRIITADYKLKKSKCSFLLYPLTPMALIDLLSILPTLTVLNNGFKLLKIFRLLRTFRIFKVFKVVRYSKSVLMIANTFKKQKQALITVCVIAAGYIVISALVIFNVEPETFNNYFDAIYWATISLTTVGYGDIYAVSTAGKIVTMISSIFGIAIVALPAGIITAGIMDQINKDENTLEDFTDNEKDFIKAYRSMDKNSKSDIDKIIKKQ